MTQWAPSLPVNNGLHHPQPMGAPASSTALIMSATDSVFPSKPAITIQPGPILNSRPTTLALVPHEHLPSSPFLPLLPPLLNPAFRIGHSSTGTLPLELDRLQSDEQFYDELQEDSWSYFLYYTPDTTSNLESDEKTGVPNSLLASVAFQPFRPDFALTNRKGSDRVKEASKTFKTVSIPVPEGCQAWEVRLLAVDLSVQRQGVAMWMMKCLEAEVIRKAREAAGAAGALHTGAQEKTMVNGELKIQLRLSTIREINEGFWMRRGFRTTVEKKLPPGCWGSPNGFTMLEMAKDLL